MCISAHKSRHNKKPPTLHNKKPPIPFDFQKECVFFAQKCASVRTNYFTIKKVEGEEFLVLIII